MAQLNLEGSSAGKRLGVKLVDDIPGALITGPAMFRVPSGSQPAISGVDGEYTPLPGGHQYWAEPVSTVHFGGRSFRVEQA